MRVEPFFLANGIATLLTSACTQQLPRDFQFPSYEAVKAAPVSLFDAIALVEKSKGGHAISVEIEVENGVTGYEIETLNDATLHEYVVDPNTGGIRKGEAAEEAPAGRQSHTVHRGHGACIAGRATTLRMPWRFPLLLSRLGPDAVALPPLAGTDVLDLRL